MPTAYTDESAELTLAKEMTYAARWGEGPLAEVSREVDKVFTNIFHVSTLKPTEALVTAACIDAIAAHGEGEEVDPQRLLQAYHRADKLAYVQKTVLPFLTKFSALLGEMDAQLEKLGIPTENRPQWVRAGLDFPDPKDSAATHISTTAYTKQEGWDRARNRVEAFLRHVAALPMAVRTGQVELDSFAASLAEGLIAE